MVEVIFPFKQGKYPFGRGKDSSHTYMQFMLNCKDEKEASHYKQINHIFKKIESINIMKLYKVLKQGDKFHMLYDFYDKSLEKRLKELFKQQQLTSIFIELQNVFEILIKQKIKAALYLQFMGVDQSNHLKVWIKPDQMEYLGHSKESEKQLKSQLSDFYQTERTRIHLEIQQVFQTNQLLSTKGLQQKHHQCPFTCQSLRKPPNFLIQGNTLVFLPREKSNRESSEDVKDQNECKNIKDDKINKDCKDLKNDVSGAQSLTADSKSLSQMSVAEKVLYYKRLKGREFDGCSARIMIKQSMGEVCGPGVHITTQLVGNGKLKVVTRQEVQVEAGSDEDLELLAKEQIAKFQGNQWSIQMDKKKELENTREERHGQGSGLRDQKDKIRGNHGQKARK